MIFPRKDKNNVGRDLKTDFRSEEAFCTGITCFVREWHHGSAIFESLLHTSVITKASSRHRNTTKMASRPSRFEENLLCPVCRDVFRDPVLLLCSHSFCWACLDQYWDTTSSQRCPVCRTDFYMDRPPCNRALKNLCEIFLQERNSTASTEVEFLCCTHGEKLELFCLEDQRLVCGVCVNADTHVHHACRPVDEAAVALKVHFSLSAGKYAYCCNVSLYFNSFNN